MTVSATLGGVLLKGLAASRPAANAVAGGTVYSATDTGAITQSDGSSWSTWATISSGLVDPMTTRGDMMIRNAANATARLGRGTAGQVLTSDGTDIAWGTPASGVHHGGLFSGSTSCASGAEVLQTLANADTKDTDAFHFVSDANLTGTVTKTAASPNIVGVGTSFTTELTVNQVISIPGTATEVGVVKTITDNTNLVLWTNMANTASGQTATRRSAAIAIPAGLGGVYNFVGSLSFPISGAGDRWGGFFKNTLGGSGRVLYQRATANWVFGGTFTLNEVDLVPGDYISASCGQDSGGALTAGLTVAMTKVG